MRSKKVEMAYRAVLGFLALTFLFGAVPAFGQSWGVSTATGYGSTSEAKGNVYVSNGQVRSDNQVRLKVNADNHKAFVQQEVHVNATCDLSGSATSGFQLCGTHDSAHYTNSTWVNANISGWTLPKAGTKVRAIMRAKLDIPFRFDISGSDQWVGPLSY